jgi:hypothetical protein
MKPPEVHSEDRWTRENPCPVCGGYQSGSGEEHCYGFMGSNGVYCTNAESTYFSDDADAWLHSNGVTANGSGPKHNVVVPLLAREPLTIDDLAAEKRISAGIFEQLGCRDVARGVRLGHKIRLRGKTKYMWLNGHGPKTDPLFPVPPRQMHATAYFTAGETDALTMRQVGFNAYAITGGEKKGRPSLTLQAWMALRKRGLKHAVIGYDGDEHGQEALAAETAAAQAAQLRVSVIDLTPYFDPFGDGVKDLNELWVHVECDRARFIERIEELTVFRPAPRLQVIYEFPPLDRTGAEDLAEVLPEVKYAIDRLHADGGNVVLIAQYKVGKTTFTLNLQRSLSDDELFLDEFDVKPLFGTVAFFNYELTAVMRRQWMQEMNFKHPERLVPPLDLRGRKAPFWESEYRKRLIDYLYAKAAEWWSIDTAQRAGSGLITDWNSNDQVDEFCGLLDEIKAEAEIPNLVLTHHQGRQVFGKDEERARGAARLEDWGDSLWYLSRNESGRRSLRASGRDVDVEAIDLDYTDRDRTYYHTGLTRDERAEDDGVRRIVALLAQLNDDGEFPGTEDFKKQCGGNRNQIHKYFVQAVDADYISRKRDPKSGALRCAVTDEGRQLLRKVAV